MKTLTELIEAHACQLECFAPVAEPPEHTQGLKLPPRLWQILEALGRGASAAELAARLGLPAETVHAVLRAFEVEGLVSKVLIPCPALPGQPMPTPVRATTVAAAATTAVPSVAAATEGGQPEMLAVEAEALASLPAEASPAHAAPAPAPQPPAPVAQAPAAETRERKGRVALKFAARSRPAPQVSAAVPAPAEAAPEASVPALSPRPETAGAARPAPVRLRLGATPRKTTTAAAETIPAAQQQAWPLQPVLDALRAKTGGDPMVGQLLAYRVFLRVPGELLQAAGIRSVCLIEPDLVINDPKLKQAIETALQDVAGLSWPAALAPAA